MSCNRKRRVRRVSDVALDQLDDELGDYLKRGNQVASETHCGRSGG